MVSQTDPEFMGIAFTFRLKDANDDDEEAQKQWLEEFNPPEEWKQ